MAQSTVTGTLTDAYVSSVDFLHTRDVYKELFDRYHEDTIIDFFEQTGRKQAAEQTAFQHHEKDYIYQNILIDAVSGTPGAGNDVVITLDITNHDNGDSIPRLNDLVIFKDKLTGFIFAKNTTVPTAHTISIRPVDQTDDIVTSAVASEIVAIYSNAHPEGSGQPEGLVTKPLLFEGIHQIFKHHYAATGSEATNKIEWVNEETGQPYYMFEAENDAYIKHKMDCAFALLFNKESDGLIDANGKVIRVTKGLAQHIREEGNLFPGGITSLSDIDDIIKILDKQRGSEENLMLNGINLNINVDNVLIDKLLNGGISYNTFGKGDEKQKAIDLGFDSFIKANYSFHKKKLSEFNHAKVTGSVGHTWPDTGMIIPTDTGRDVVTGETIESIQMRYKKAPHLDREYIHTLSGILAPHPVGDIDELGFDYISEKGLQVFGLNRFILIED